MKKISFNGKEYNSFDDLPEEAKKYFPDQNKNGMPDMNGGATINYQGKNYGSRNELPPEARAKMDEAMRRLKGTPFIGKILGTAVDSSGQINPEQMVQMMTQKAAGGAKMAIVVSLVFMAGIGAFIWGVFQMISAGEETFELSTDPQNFDPIASYEEVKNTIDPEAQLISFRASYVRSDGTMDLNATYTPKPSTNYKFFRELPEAPEDAPPVGAGSSPDGKWYERVTAEVYTPGQWRHVTSVGGGVSTEYSYQNKGVDLERDDAVGSIPGEPASAPECSLKDLWSTAIGKGAPENAVAVITYDADGYVFSIYDAQINLEFSTDCKLVA
ncbi:MAG TPA: hypothetical protein VI588_01965 [Candidatus Gracilibacteria bacterium]|nr:hypothetical protein [Candidatus Gracilibacteria bacterium]